MSKGSSRRPTSISTAEADSNWDRIFSKKENTSEDNKPDENTLTFEKIFYFRRTRVSYSHTYYAVKGSVAEDNVTKLINYSACYQDALQRLLDTVGGTADEYLCISEGKAMSARITQLVPMST